MRSRRASARARERVWVGRLRAHLEESGQELPFLLQLLHGLSQLRIHVVAHSAMSSCYAVLWLRNSFRTDVHKNHRERSSGVYFTERERTSEPLV
jgi:hypothetical protein